jgi:hypothetical protein
MRKSTSESWIPASAAHARDNARPFWHHFPDPLLTHMFELAFKNIDDVLWNPLNCDGNP